MRSTTHVIAVWSAGAPFLDAALRRLDAHDARHHVLAEEPGTHDFEAAADARALVVGGCPVTGGMLDRLPQLGLVVRAGVGVDKIDVGAATERGVLVTNISDYCVQEVADHTMLLMLAASRRLRQFARQVESDWTGVDHPPVRRLDGGTCGVIGLGAIGSAVAVRARALGMSVIACDPWIAPERFAAVGASAVTFDELLEQSDVITLHVPMSPENRHLLDADAFTRMRRSPVIVNTARGGLVDTGALLGALESGAVAGAGLDTLDEEPDLSDRHDLLDRDDVVVTPHVAWYSEDAREQLGRMAADIAVEYERTGTVARVLNPEAAQAVRR